MLILSFVTIHYKLTIKALIRDVPRQILIIYEWKIMSGISYPEIFHLENSSRSSISDRCGQGVSENELKPRDCGECPGGGGRGRFHKLWIRRLHGPLLDPERLLGHRLLLRLLWKSIKVNGGLFTRRTEHEDDPHRHFPDCQVRIVQSIG